jgi:hypothetical protein
MAAVVDVADAHGIGHGETKTFHENLLKTSDE